MTIGCTIREAQERMGAREVEIWARYRAKNGPLSPIRAYDRPAAVICSTLAAVFGNKANLEDFMPFGREEKVIDNNALIKALVSAGKARVAR